MRQISLAITILPILWLQTASAITLTDTNGVSITGEISSYSPRTGLVQIKQDESITTRPLSAFTVETQESVILWRADKNFNRKSNLDTTFRQHYTEASSNVVGTVEDVFTKKKRETTLGTITSVSCTCKVSIKNESDTPFKNLTVDYRVFFTQQLSPNYTGQYQLAGKTEYDTLAPETTWSFETNPFTSSITHKPAPGIRWRRPYDTSSNILGILLRIRKPDLTGEWMEQDIELGEIPRKRDRSNYQKVYE